MTSLTRAAGVRSLGPGLERGALAGLTLLAATLAFELVQPLVSLGPMVLTNVETLLLLCVGLWAAARVAAGRRPHVPRTVALPAVVWLGVLLVSALLAPAHRLDALKFVGRMTGAALAAWVAYDLSLATGRRASLLRALALGGLLVGLFGLAEATQLPAILHFLAAFKQGPTVVGEALRVSSTLEYATITSMVLELTVPLLLAWVLVAGHRWGRLLLAGGLVAVLAAQALTLTRGGAIALLAALGWMAAWAAWRRRRALSGSSFLAGATLLALWAAMLIVNPVTRYRLVSETQQSWYQAAYQAPQHLILEAGQAIYVPVTVRNAGVRTWQTGREHSFSLGYHLARPDGTVVQFDGAHIALPYDVPPGAQVQVHALVKAPARDGEYVVEWDMVQEGVTWFSWEGSAPARTGLTVVSAAAAGQTLPPDLPPSPAAASRPAGTVTPGEQGRLWLWQVAAGMVARHPLLGVGPDNFRWLHGAYAGVAGADNRVHANNLYIEWLVDTGIVGLAAFLWLTWRLARAAYAGLEGDGRAKEHVVWQLAITGSLVAWFVHGLLDFFYEFTPTYLAFALLCGLALVRRPPVGDGGRPCASDSM
jgi:hypothetical protein